MTRGASFLAALASAALPGLDPVAVQLVRGRPEDAYDTAFVEDSQERSWVVQAPRTPVAGALLEDVATLATLLGRRLDIGVPMVRGQAVVPEGRAVVYPRLPGRPLDFSGLVPGLGLAADLGRALAHIHNLEVELFDEAGRPTYDAPTTRSRLLTDLDRAAATGHVPTALLSRWEHALEDVTLWRFLPTPVHGSLVGANVLATFDTEEDADAGRVRAVLGWEESHVGDPAEDFADLVAGASPAALESVLDAYAPSRIDRPDPHLLDRARIASELRVVRRLLRAQLAEDRHLVEEVAVELRRLEDRVFAGVPAPRRATGTQPARRALLSEVRGEARADEPRGVEDRAVRDPRDADRADLDTPGEDRDPEGAAQQDHAHADSARGEDEQHAGPRDDQHAGPRGDQPDAMTAPPRPRAAPAHLDTVALPMTADPPAGAAATGRNADGGTTGSGEDEVAQVVAQDDAATDMGDADDGSDTDDEDDGVLDLHEGASEFIRVEPRSRAAPVTPPAEPTETRPQGD